jgi:transposase
MKKSRRKFTATFKTKVVLEALKERLTLQELASKFELQPTQITLWKKEFLNNATAAFETKSKIDDSEKEKDQLFGKIGRLEVENDFLRKVLGK